MIETGGIPGYYFYPHIGSVWITGPYNAKGADETASRRKVLVCRPADRTRRAGVRQRNP